MLSEIRICCDCGDHFCLACDVDYRPCPECGDDMCGACADLSLELRMARCLTCGSDDLTCVRMPYHGDGDYRRRLYKHYTTPQRGRMPCD